MLIALFLILVLDVIGIAGQYAERFDKRAEGLGGDALVLGTPVADTSEGAVALHDVDASAGTLVIAQLLERAAPLHLADDVATGIEHVDFTIHRLCRYIDGPFTIVYQLLLVRGNVQITLLYHHYVWHTRRHDGEVVAEHYFLLVPVDMAEPVDGKLLVAWVVKACRQLCEERNTHGVGHAGPPALSIVTGFEGAVVRCLVGCEVVRRLEVQALNDQQVVAVGAYDDIDLTVGRRVAMIVGQINHRSAVYSVEGVGTAAAVDVQVLQSVVLQEVQTPDVALAVGKCRRSHFHYRHFHLPFVERCEGHAFWYRNLTALTVIAGNLGFVQADGRYAVYVVDEVSLCDALVVRSLEHDVVVRVTSLFRRQSYGIKRQIGAERRHRLVLVEVVTRLLLAVRLAQRTDAALCGVLLSDAHAVASCALQSILVGWPHLQLLFVGHEVVDTRFHRCDEHWRACRHQTAFAQHVSLACVHVSLADDTCCCTIG